MNRILVLAFGALAPGLDAYVVAGIVPTVASGLRVSISSTGQLVTAFTLSYGLLSPILAALLIGRPVRLMLLAALMVFTIGNALSAQADSPRMTARSRLPQALQETNPLGGRAGIAPSTCSRWPCRSLASCRRRRCAEDGAD